MITRSLKSALLAATAVIALTGAAEAQVNSIAIGVNGGGTVKTLAINQDDVNLGNVVSANPNGSGSLPVRGPWNSISTNQAGGANSFNGALTSGAGSTTASLNAGYTGGRNAHTLSIGGTTAPVNPTVTISAHNTGGGANTIVDTLNGTSLNYNLSLSGTGNSLTNSVAATGAVALGQTITGSNNTVGNTVSGVASFDHTLGLSGSGNVIANTANTGGAKTISQSITGSDNLVTVGLTGAGTQSAYLTTDSTTRVDFTQDSAAANSHADVYLSSVTGALGTAAKVTLTQTAAADGAAAVLGVYGGSYTMGTSGPGGAGVYVNQNSPGAVLNATVTAGANGYTASFVQ